MSIRVSVGSLESDYGASLLTQEFSSNEVEIGCLPGRDIFLDSVDVAERHARLIARRDQVTGEPNLFVMDLRSLGGTMVGDDLIEPFSEVRLKRGQTIQIGRFVISAELDPTSFVDTVDISLNPEELEMPEGEARGQSGDAMSADETVGLAREADSAFDEAKGKDNVVIHIGPDMQPESSRDEQALHTEMEIGAKGDNIEANSMMVGGQDGMGVSGPVGQISGVLDESDVNELDFEARRLCRLSGAVIHKDKPLSGVKVIAGDLGEAETDDDGRFAFSRIEEDSHYRLSFEKSGFTFAPDAVDGQLSEDVAIVVAAIKRRSIGGRVYRKGAPVEGVEIDGGLLGKTFTDKDGFYSFNNVPEGSEFTLVASKDGFVFGAQKVRK